MASEMLYPIMPVFLSSIGFSVVLIGVLEGFAEMVAGLSKGYFGQLSDVRQKRLPFVQLGYFLSAISKPMLALFSTPVWIFFSRTIDRTGKGLRSAPRDALLSNATTKENKAKVFGFHRSMDTFGAVLGPLIALWFLACYPGQYQTLFIIAFIPGLAAVLFTFFVKEKAGIPQQKKIHFFSFLSHVKNADGSYKKLLWGLLIFALVNSSDVLLLLKMKSTGVSDVNIITIYIFYNLIYALSAFPAGIIADKWGIKNTFLFGLILFIAVYIGFAFVNMEIGYWILFFIYGIYAACTEGIAKAWITNIVPGTSAGTAIGAYTGLASMAAFGASALAGVLWAVFGPEVAFGFTACVVTVVVLYLMRVPAATKA
ncbi:MAG: MFS transporter [Bacteroidetes bacterium]|nr:MFS transporter [Bacteroidota bacterium]